jgi:hypothetical protein
LWEAESIPGQECGRIRKYPVTAFGFEIPTFRVFSTVPQPTASQRTEETSLIFTHIYLINVAKLTKFSMTRQQMCYLRQGDDQHKTSGMLVPTAYSIDHGAGSDLSICFAVTSRILPSKEHKINNRTCNV